MHWLFYACPINDIQKKSKSELLKALSERCTNIRSFVVSRKVELPLVVLETVASVCSDLEVLCVNSVQVFKSTILSFAGDLSNLRHMDLYYIDYLYLSIDKLMAALLHMPLLEFLKCNLRFTIEQHQSIGLSCPHLQRFLSGNIERLESEFEQRLRCYPSLVLLDLPRSWYNDNHQSHHLNWLPNVCPNISELRARWNVTKYTLAAVLQMVPQLTEVTLEHVELIAEELQPLARASHLKVLRCIGIVGLSTLFLSALRPILQHCTELHTLELQCSGKSVIYSYASLADLLSLSTSLQLLSVSRCVSYTACDSHTKSTICGSPVSRGDWDRLVKEFPHLRIATPDFAVPKYALSEPLFAPKFM
jgi:hypothetical protein